MGHTARIAEPRGALPKSDNHARFALLCPSYRDATDLDALVICDEDQHGASDAALVLVRKQQELLADRKGQRLRLSESIEFQIVQALYRKHLTPLEVKRIQLDVVDGAPLTVCVGTNAFEVETVDGWKWAIPYGCGCVFANNLHLTRRTFANVCPDCQNNNLRRRAAARVRRVFAYRP